MSFRENFTREEQQDDLQYDDSAFHTFAATILIVILLPLLYYIYKRCFVSQELCNEKKYTNCKCSICREKLTNHYNAIKSKNLSFKFYFMIFLAIGISYLIYQTHNEMIKNDGKLKNFTPYDILEIPSDADPKTIKRTYRELAKKLHPDKNPNNPQAKARFILVTKAYEVFLIFLLNNIRR